MREPQNTKFALKNLFFSLFIYREIMFYNPDTMIRIDFIQDAG